MKIKGYAKLRGANKVYYERCVSGELLFLKNVLVAIAVVVVVD